MIDELERKRNLYNRINTARLPQWRVEIRYKLFKRSARDIERIAGGVVEDLPEEPIDAFEVAVLLALITSMIVMGFYQPLSQDSGQTTAVKIINMILAIFFIFEAVMRFICFGKDIFLHDPWNLIDLVIVVVAVVSAALDIAGLSIGSFTVLRTIRVLRPLRSVVTFPAARTLVVSMIGAVRSLSDVALLYILFLASFGIIGVSQFSGRLRAKCVNNVYWSVATNTSNPGHLQYVNYSITDFVCGSTYDTSMNRSLISCNVEQRCNKNTGGRLIDGFICPWGYTCVDVENPFYGMISFDSLPAALLTLFVSVTGQVWYTACFMLMDAFDGTAAYFFVSVVVIGMFFIVNLSVVLITISFESTTAFQQQKMSRLTKMRRRSTVASSSNQSRTTVIRNTRMRALTQTRRGTVVDYDVPVDAAEMRRQNRVNILTNAHALTGGGGFSFADMEPDAADVEPVAPGSPPVWSDKTAAAQKYDGMWEEQTRKIKPLSDFRKVVKVWFDRDYISHFINACIVLNIFFMSLQYYGQPDGLTTFLSVTNLIFTVLFGLEFVIRLIYVGPHKYFRKPVNVIDVIVLIVSIVDVSSLGNQIPSIRALRSMRLMKLLKSFPGVLRWAVVVMASLKASFLLVVTIFVFNYIAACFAMQLLGGEFCDLGADEQRPDNSVPFCLNRPRANFDTIGIAMLSAFQVTTGDNWDNIMYNAMRAVHPLASLGFVFYDIASNYVLMNILIGILLSGPSPEEVNSMSEELFETKVDHQANTTTIAKLRAMEGVDLSGVNPEEFDNTIGRGGPKDLVVNADGELISVAGPVRNRNAQDIHLSEHERDRMIDEEGDLALNWKLRLRAILTHTHFESMMLLLIFLSCFAMAFEDPLAAPDTGLALLLFYTDVTATALFIVEVAVNCFAFGIIKSPSSYLRRDRWNAIDFMVVLVSLIGIFGEYLTGARWFRVALSIRAIRPLRFVKRSPGLRTVFHSFLRSIVPLRHIIVLALMVWTCWGLMGVELFKGSFYTCSDSTIQLQANCTASGHRWNNAQLHFDHLPAAFLALFDVASLDGWVDIMHDGMDSVGPGRAMVVNHSSMASIFFVTFVLVGGYFMVNLVVSVVIDTYNTEKAKVGDRCVYLSEAQNAYVRSHRRMIRGVPHVFFDSQEAPLWRQKLREIVATRAFDYISTTVMILNCVLLMVLYYGAPRELDLTVYVLSVIFVMLFAAEIAAKTAALGWKYFMESRFNRFDLVITALCLIGVLGEFFKPSEGWSFIFRAMRTISLFRVVRRAGRLRFIITRFSFALYGIGNVAALLFLCFYMYAVMGMRSFGLVKWQTAITSQSNFTNFIRSCLVLLQCLTGGGWTQFMSDSAVSTPDCDPHINDCGVPVFSQIFYVTFVAITYFILLNLFIAVILDCFIATNYTTEVISKEHVREFFDKWFEIDAKQEMRISGAMLLPLLRSLTIVNPLGLGYVPIEYRPRHEFAFIRALRLQEIDGYIELQSLVMSLCRFVFGVSLPDYQVAKLQAQADKRFRRFERERRRRTRDMRRVPAVYRVAATIIEKSWIEYLKRGTRQRGIDDAVRTMRMGAGAGTVGSSDEAAAALRLRELHNLLGDGMTFAGDTASLTSRDAVKNEAPPNPHLVAAKVWLLANTFGDGNVEWSPSPERDPSTFSSATRRLLDDAAATEPFLVARDVIGGNTAEIRAEIHAAAEADFLLSAMRREARIQMGCVDADDEFELRSTLFGPLRPESPVPLLDFAAVPNPPPRGKAARRAIDPADLEMI